MTTIFSKLLLWLKGQAVSFILILVVLIGINLYSTYIQTTGGPSGVERQEKLLNEKRSGCDAIKNELAKLKSDGMILPFTARSLKKKVLSEGIDACELAITNMEGELGRLIEAQEAHWYVKWVQPNLWPAFFALFLMFAIPQVLKVIFYYVLAPMASRRHPLVIISEANGSEHSALKPEQRTQIGAVSQSVVLTPNQELLVHSDYLQTSPLHAKKRTKWLLNNKIPLSSISSGMYMLTRVECSTQDPIVVSSTKDHLSEVGIVELPDGAAFVCQPRSLVCQRRLNIEPPCRFNIEPGRVANSLIGNCG